MYASLTLAYSSLPSTQKNEMGAALKLTSRTLAATNVTGYLGFFILFLCLANVS